MKNIAKKTLVLLVLFNFSFLTCINVCSEGLDPKTIYGTLYIDTNNDGNYEIAPAGVDIIVEVNEYTNTKQTDEYDEINYIIGIEPGHTDQTCTFSIEYDQVTYIPDDNQSIVLSEENENGPTPGYYIIDLHVTTEPTTNNPPEKPTASSPESNAKNIELNPTLSVYVADPDGDHMDVTFYDDGDNYIDREYNVPSGTRASVSWSGLDYNTGYSWYAVADDKKSGTNTSNTWMFTTKSAPEINHPPTKPTNPKPDNNSEENSLNPQLSVFVTDPDDDQLTVSFYNASNDQLIVTASNVQNATNAKVTWYGLDFNTYYTWYAIANDTEFETRSDVFTFKTIEEDNTPPDVSFEKPEEGSLYFFGNLVFPGVLRMPFILGKINIVVKATDDETGISRADLTIKGNWIEKTESLTTSPYTYEWSSFGFGKYNITATAYDMSGNSANTSMIVHKFL